MAGLGECLGQCCKRESLDGKGVCVGAWLGKCLGQCCNEEESRYGKGDGRCKGCHACVPEGLHGKLGVLAGTHPPAWPRLAACLQLLLSLELYILGPYCRRQVAAAAPAAHLGLTAAMVAAAAALLAPLSPLLTSAFGCSTLFVTFLCPMWLVRIHKFKAAINGPWDEAVPRLSTAVTRHLSRH